MRIAAKTMLFFMVFGLLLAPRWTFAESNLPEDTVNRLAKVEDGTKRWGEPEVMLRKFIKEHYNRDVLYANDWHTYLSRNGTFVVRAVVAESLKPSKEGKESIALPYMEGEDSNYVIKISQITETEPIKVAEVVPLKRIPDYKIIPVEKELIIVDVKSNSTQIDNFQYQYRPAAPQISQPKGTLPKLGKNDFR